MATVHVVIPCYNYAHYLRDCVASVQSQEGVDVRIVIIDDASSDESYEVARDLASRDPRISVIRHETNKGHIATYNEGLALASSTYVVLLSADDLLTPGALRRATALMDAHPSVGLVYGHPLTFDGAPLPPPRAGKASWSVWEGRDWIALMCRTGRNFICCPEVVLRTSVQHRIGGYNRALPHSGDMEMWLRAAAVCDVGRINGADQAYYRVHDQSMQRTIHAGYLFDLKGRRDAFRSVLGAPGCPVPGEGDLLAEAHRVLAVSALRQARRARRAAEAPEAIEELCRFAVETSPGIVESREWRRIRRPSGRRRHSPWLVRLGEIGRDLRQRVDWRRWRRTGINWSP